MDVICLHNQRGNHACDKNNPAGNFVPAMNGLPWTLDAMTEAVSSVRPGGSIGFAFGFESLEKLLELDSHVFSVRPDLKLHVWTVADSGIYSDEELQTPASLGHVRTLEISITRRQSFLPLAKLAMLESLALKNRAPISLAFLPSLKKLTSLDLLGKYDELDLLGDCTALQKLYLSTALTSYGLIASLPGLRSLIVDACTAPTDFLPLSRAGLESLHLSGIRKLDTVDSITSLSGLQRLSLCGAPHLHDLPALSWLENLRILELRGLKAWTNPEALNDMGNLEYLQLEEINTKIEAEQFAFLPDLPKLARIDFRFIDSGKRRRQKLESIFQQANRSALVVRDDKGDS